MSTKGRLPTTLLEAVRYFSDLDVATEFVARLRWPERPHLPRLRREGPRLHHHPPTVEVQEQDLPQAVLGEAVGTIFEDSPIPLDKWLRSIWLIANAKNGVVVARARPARIGDHAEVGVVHSPPHAARHADRHPSRSTGEVEVDETFIGGKARNMHADVRARKIHGTGGKDKTKVLGIIERGGRVQREGCPRTFASGRSKRRSASGWSPDRRSTPTPRTPTTDWSEDYEHETVDHAVEYVRGQVSTNSIENFWIAAQAGPARAPMSAWSRSTCSATSMSRSTASTPARTTTSDGSRVCWRWSAGDGSPGTV